MSRRRQGGFTLIELMVALLVSSLLVGMILAIYSRMSLAYRGQQQIAGVQQVLGAARAMIEVDAKQAGLGMAQGFTTAPTTPNPLIGPPPVQSPVQVFDSSTGPDQIRFFYADPATQAAVSADSTDWRTLNVDGTLGFAPGDLIVLSKARPSMVNPVDSGEANIATYAACVVQIDPAPDGVVAGSPASIKIVNVADGLWGGTSHCEAALNPPPDGTLAWPPAGPPKGTMVYKFVAHAYRIDTSTPARAALGPLQQSLTGGLLGGAEVWNDLAYGFTDIQAAERIYRPSPPPPPDNDPDADGDDKRDWYSDANQSAMNLFPPVVPFAANAIPPQFATLLQMSISLVARTNRDVEGIATQRTPDLIDPAHPNNNAIGNRPFVALPSAADPALQGQRIYRYVTFQVDFRNLGVGL